MLPEAHIVFEADVSPDGRPLIRVTLPESPREPTRVAAASPQSVDARSQSGGSTALRAHDDLKQPDAICEGCGAVGTVGKIGRANADGVDLEVHRFCYDCWPEQKARYEARQKEQRRRMNSASSEEAMSGLVDHGHWYFVANSWHEFSDMVEDIERRMHTPPPPGPQQLRDMARWFSGLVPVFDDPMPDEVRAFISQYGTRSPG